jgi:single-strand DNA-binding protein
MKYGINKVTLLGNVGDLPKVTEKNGEPLVANFPLATSEFFKDKNGEETQVTQWHRVKVWNKKADLVQKYVKKGDALYIEGKIVNNNWEDKEGNKRYSTEIECDNFLFLSNRPRKDEEGN